MFKKKVSYYECATLWILPYIVTEKWKNQSVKILIYQTQLNSGIEMTKKFIFYL